MSDRKSADACASHVSILSEPVSGVTKVARVAVAEDAAPEGAPKAVRLLLVEDSEQDAALLLRELQHGGFAPQCRRVTTRREFQEALDSQRWDAIIADYVVPGYGGMNALDDLVASRRDIPLILVSGFVAESLAVDAMRAGARDYVLKKELGRLPLVLSRELREKVARLEQRRMRDQLMISERMAAAGTLAAGVAHEINNPLSIAITNVEYVVNTLAALLAEERADGHREPWNGWRTLEQVGAAVRDANEGLRRIRDIVADVRTFSRPLDGKADVIDVQSVLDSTARMAWNEIRHRAKLTKDYRSAPPIQGNESRLGQVILNLVINAAQAIPEGHAQENEIRLVTATDEGGLALLEVHDTGCGIPPENLESIFDPFFTTKPAPVGTGLGLSICHRIVSELGGTIEVESTPGKGTVFRLRFPPAPADSRPAIRRRVPASAYRARVLVVDDEAAMGDATRRMLSYQHDVVSVTRAQEALSRIAGGERFDLILADLMMPDITGIALFERLQRVSESQARRVVFITGGVFASSALQHLEGIPNRVLEKPFRAADLLGALNELGPSKDLE